GAIAEAGTPGLEAARSLNVSLQHRGLDTTPPINWPVLPDQISGGASPSPTVPAGLTVGQRGSDSGCEDFEKLLLDAGARSQNASKPWVENHLQWICWKLAAKEAQHTKLKGKLRDADVVLDELKMRYEREVNRGQSSWLKRLLEQDVPASHAMVLRIAVGMKLRVCGSELQGQQQEALVAAKSTTLTLIANGVKRATLSSKLGQQRQRSVHLPLTAIDPAGGMVPQTDVVIQRKGPVLIWARAPDGSSYTTTQKGHAQALGRQEAHACQVSETVAAELQGEEAARCRRALTPLGKRKAAAGEELYAQALLSEGNGAGLGRLTDQQQHQLESFKEKRKAEMEAQQQKMLSQRLGAGGQAAGSPVMRLLVAPVIHKDVHPEKIIHAPWSVIRIWRPTDDIMHLSEGDVYSVSGLIPVERSGRGRTPLELSSGRTTCWERQQPTPASCLRWAFQPRVWLQLEQVLQQMPGSYIDCFGMAIGATAIQHPEHHTAQQFVFLVDQSVQRLNLQSKPKNDWMLGIRLTKSGDIMGFLELPNQSTAFCWFKSLRLSHFDMQNCICNLEVDSLTTGGVYKAPPRDQHLTDQKMQDLLAWSQAEEVLMQKLQGRVSSLI
ncbi:hypothetical protein WJX84_010763, partial [Apatococcus fuscideae]